MDTHPVSVEPKQEFRKVKKFGGTSSKGRADSGLTPLVGIGLTDLPKIREVSGIPAQASPGSGIPTRVQKIAYLIFSQIFTICPPIFRLLPKPCYDSIKLQS